MWVIALPAAPTSEARVLPSSDVDGGGTRAKLTLHIQTMMSLQSSFKHFAPIHPPLHLIPYQDIFTISPPLPQAVFVVDVVS